MLKNQDLNSVNQIAAQIKLTKICKATNVEDFPIKVIHQTTSVNVRVTRGNMSNTLVEKRKTTLNLNSCISDETSLWNLAPAKIRSATSLTEAKREIKSFISTLPQ